MPGTFEIYTDKAGKMRFRLKAANGQIILSSQGYANKSGCRKGIESVKKNAVSAENFAATETASGKFAFNLLASNKQVVGTSQQYKTTASRDKGISSVIAHAPEAKVVDVEG